MIEVGVNQLAEDDFEVAQLAHVFIGLGVWFFVNELSQRPPCSFDGPIRPLNKFQLNFNHLILELTIGFP